MATIEEVIAQHTSSLMDIPGVAGVGQSEINGVPCIYVMLEYDTPEVKAAIPGNIEGYPVATEITEEFHAQALDDAPSV